MKHIIAWITVLALTCASFQPATAAVPQQVGIVAVVNDEIISSLDLEERMRLVMSTTGLQNTPEVRQRLAAQILRNLVDETLQTQEAERYNISISESQIDRAVRTVEAQQGKPQGSLPSFFEQNDLSMESFRNQLEAQLAWNEFISRELRRNVTIGSDEIARRQERAMNNSAVEEVQLSSIIMPVDKPENEQKVATLAKELREQIGQGASFEALATQLSASGGALTTNKVWVSTEQLEPRIRATVDKLSEGNLSQPVRTVPGYQLIRLDGRRMGSRISDDAEVALKQILLSLDETAQEKEVSVLLDIAKAVSRHPGSCTEPGIAGVQDFEGLNIDVEYVRTRFVNMSPQVRPLVENLRVTEISEPFATPEGIQLLMLCERIDVAPQMPAENLVRQELFREKLDLESAKYLRNLRREAFIDIRI
tara:strand:+ start:210 stop:1478 length:1269 start_codon:yes stop_codon:yes gene_type:complete